MQTPAEITTSWEKLQNTNKPIVLYGTGNGADRVLDELIRLGIPVSGITASSGFVRKRLFRGFPVMSLAEAEARFGDFFAAIAFASSLPEVMGNMYALAEKHETVMPCVPVYGEEICNREFVRTHRAEIEAAYRLLADDLSKRVFKNGLLFQLTGELPILKATESDKAEALTEILKLSGKEDYLDLGAYRGDTIAELLQFSGGTYRTITALEPSRKTFQKLSDFAGGMENTTLIHAAVGDKIGTHTFMGNAGRGSSLGNRGEEIPVTTVDEICKGKRVSYLKMDVEGAEYEAILGGRETLQAKKPKLNIAAYHRSTDLFRLPLLLHEINPAYQIYLRHHPYIPFWDTNLYCV